jgi:hypothetical protein
VSYSWVVSHAPINGSDTSTPRGRCLACATTILPRPPPSAANPPPPSWEPYSTTNNWPNYYIKSMLYKFQLGFCTRETVRVLCPSSHGVFEWFQADFNAFLGSVGAQTHELRCLNTINSVYIEEKSSIIHKELQRCIITRFHENLYSNHQLPT